jgi:hypothetical protein
LFIENGFGFARPGIQNSNRPQMERRIHRPRLQRNDRTALIGQDGQQSIAWADRPSC